MPARPEHVPATTQRAAMALARLSCAPPPTCSALDCGLYCTVSAADTLLRLPTRSLTAPALTHTLRGREWVGKVAGWAA